MSTIIPDQDTIIAAWGAMVRANREQVERFQETEPSKDFYAPVASSFKADPYRTGEDILDYLRTIARPNETWLDIGGGAGRYALPLALNTKSVTVIDPSDGMLELLREGMREHGISNVEAVSGRWPEDRGNLSASVAFISHVGYDVEEIGPFLEAMEAAATERCVAILLNGAPASVASPFWPAVHGEARGELPGSPEFITLLLSRGIVPAIQLFERPPATYPGTAEVQRFLRHQLWVEPGSAKDDLLAAEIERLAVPVAEGIQFSDRPMTTAVIEWKPARLSS